MSQKLYCVIFREYQNIETIQFFVKKYGSFGHRWTKELFFQNLDDVYLFLEKYWIINNKGWAPETEVHKDLQDLKNTINTNLGINCPIISAIRFNCEVMLIIVPDIDDVMKSPLLN